jgi:hypothetical protein
MRNSSVNNMDRQDSQDRFPKILSILSIHVKIFIAGAVP